jgi:uncharacterized protein YbaR (Trm112 family)
MKTQRITLLGSPEFKAFLAAEAEKEQVSVSELVRRRCERAPSEEESIPIALAAELKKSIADAKQSLNDGLAAVREALEEAKPGVQKEAA